MELIDVKIYIGNNADVVSKGLLPVGIENFSPYIRWQLPSKISQVRFAIKITNIANPQLVWIYKGISSRKQLQIPIGNGFNSQWLGLCFIQIQVSQFLQYKVGNQFQYTSGQQQDNPNGYFVLDPNMERLSVGSGVQYYWTKSVDENIQQNLIYHLQVAKHPLFKDDSLVLNQTQIVGNITGYVSFNGTQLSNGFYFFRVRAYDGYDWSDWSVINAFQVRTYSPPQLYNLQYEITNDQYGNVIISFDSDCQQEDFVSVVLTYCSVDDLSMQYPCSLNETSHIVPNGHNQVLWRSSEDIKIDGQFYLYAFAYCNGVYSETIIVNIKLQNYKYSIVDTTVSNTKVNFNVVCNLAPVLKKVYYNYTGWKANIYSDKLQGQNFFVNGKYDFASFVIVDVLNPPRKQYSYIGWDSEINYESITDERSVKDKYKRQNMVFNRYVIADYKDFCLYADGRNFTVHNDDQYCIQDEKNSMNPNQDISLNLSEGGGDEKKVVVKPPLQKAASYAPQFKGELPAQGGVDRKGNSIEIAQKINFVYTDVNGDWNVKAWVDAKEGEQGYDNGKKYIYLKVWGGALQAGDNKGDQTLETIVKLGQDRYVYEQYSSKIGAYTLPDGQLKFEDDKNAPQYTAYPNVYDCSGYPSRVDDEQRQAYWEGVKLNQLYIKKYKVQKGGAEPGGIYCIGEEKYSNVGYKDFTLEKKSGCYHRYYSNKKIPMRLLLKKNALCDQFEHICYLYDQQDNLFQLSTDKYNDLPQKLKFDDGKNNLVFDSFYVNSQKQFLTYEQKLYFQQYNRVYNYSRGKSPQLGNQCWNCDGTGLDNGKICDMCCGVIFDEQNGVEVDGKNGKYRGNGKTVIDQKTKQLIQIKQPPFSNVAVPYYVPALNAVFSTNGYNGRKSAFDLGFKIKRDKRRYVLGHYYSYQKKQTNLARLQVLNDFLQKFYSDIDFTLPQFDNIIIHYKYKYLKQGSVDEISQDNYIYVPVYIQDKDSGDYICKRAWFIDNSDSKFKNVSLNKQFNWNSIDDGDYICIYRDFIGFDSTFVSIPHKIRQRNLIQQGTKYFYDLITKKNYYSDKSQFGVQSYDVVGDLSDVVSYDYNAMVGKNQYTLIDRVVRLNHKDVVENSIKVYYYDNDEKVYIDSNSFQYKPSNSYYNASVKIKQNNDYIDKVIYIDYSYYEYENYNIDSIDSDIINFSNYDEQIYFTTPTLKADTFTLSFNTGQLLDNKFYLLQKEKNIVSVQQDGSQKFQQLTNYKLRLVPFYNNKKLYLNYMYRQYTKAQPIVFNLPYSDENVLYKDGDNFVISGLDSDLIEDSISISCLSYKERDHLVPSAEYMVSNGVFTLNLNQEYFLKPFVIKYKYKLIQNNFFTVKFTGFNTYLREMYVDVSTIKIYYILQNGVQKNITNYFNIYADGELILYYGYPSIDNSSNSSDMVDNTYMGERLYNVKIQLAVYDKQRLQQVFGNNLNVSYNDGVNQELYLSLPNVYREELLDGFNYQLYFDKDKSQVVNDKLYFITNNKITLKTQSNYLQVVPYLNKEFWVFYQTYDYFENQLSAFQYSFKILNLDDYYDLQNINIVPDTFCIYYLNECYGLTELQNDDYQVLYNTGKVKLKKQSYLNVDLFVSYEYQDQVLKTAQVSKIFNYVGEQFVISNKVKIDTIYAYIDDEKYKKSIGLYQVTAENNEIEIEFNDIAKIICVDQNGENINTTYYEYNKTENKIIFFEQLYGTNVVVYYIEKLSATHYLIDGDDFKIFANSVDIISDPQNAQRNQIKVIFNYKYVEKIILNKKYNNIINNNNQQLIITQQQIDNRSKLPYEVQQGDTNEYRGYVTTHVDLNDDVYQWQVYYQYDLVDKIEFQYRDFNNEIVVLRNIDQIDQWLKLQYNVFYGQYKNVARQVVFKSSFEEIFLQHSYVKAISLSYKGKNDIAEFVDENDYQLIFGKNSVLSLTNRFLRVDLFAKYDNVLTVYHKKSFVCVKSSDVYDDISLLGDFCLVNLGQLVDVNSISVYNQSENIRYKLQIEQYHCVVNQLDCLLIIDDFFEFYKDKTLTVQYSTNMEETVQDNQHIEYLQFKSYNTTLFLNHPYVYNYVLKYYSNQLLQDGKTYSNSWQQIPQQYYNFNAGQLRDGELINASVSMIQQPSTIRFFRKKLILSYSVQKQSLLKTVSFLNNRSLIFKDQNGYILLAHSYIKQDSLIIYYQDENGIYTMPKDAYQVDIGNEEHYAIIVLNKQYNGYQNYINRRLIVQYRYIKNPKIVYKNDNQKFPYLDYVFKSHIINTVSYYYEGYPVSEHQGYYYRNQPTYLQGRGVRLKTKFKEPSIFTELKFVYLQSVWDAYNTIHMQGVLDVNAQIVLQYGQVDNIGYVDQRSFKDFITVKSKYNSDINYYLLQPLTYDVFVDTFDDSVFAQKQNYILRMRLYNTLSNSFTSEWIYSSIFQIDHDAVNPVNITNISYDPWTRKCLIEFRIDDTSGDLYDLIGFAYTANGNSWFSISEQDILGVKTQLKSNQRFANSVIIHKIYWNTSNYTLTPSSTYRIRINATYTKYNNGDQPMFLWQCALNPKIDYFQAKLFTLNGGKQYYKMVTEKTKKITHNDGSVSFQQLETPVNYWQKIQPYEYTLLDNFGNPLVDESGNVVTQIRDYAIVDGQLQTNQKKIQQIKSRPYKTVFQDGQFKTKPWGYLQYCDVNGRVVDYDGYVRWLSQNDSVYGQPRQALINQLQNQNEKIRLQIAEYKQKILECQMQNRRKLIRQGFYSNGFLYNQYGEDPTVFMFRLKSKPSTKKEKSWLQQNTQYGVFQIKYNLQLDFLDTYDSQFNHTPLRDFYTYDIGDITLDITAGVNRDDLEQSALYKGNFTINSEHLPGKYMRDVNNFRGDYSYDYYWRVRPYVQFKDKKRQVCRTNIIGVSQDSNNVILQVELRSHKEAGVLTTSVYRDFVYGDKYKIYYRKKSNDGNLYLIQPHSNKDNYDDCDIIAHINKNNVLFLTDRLTDDNGIFLQGGQPFLNWISFSINRHRPQVLIYDNEYYMFYDKSGLYKQNLIYMSVSKNGCQFGEYAQLYPYTPTEDIKNDKFIGLDNYQTTLNNLKNPFAIREDNGFVVFAAADFQRYDKEKNRNIVFMKSDWSGDKFQKPIICFGLQNCDYPNVFSCEAKQKIINDDGKLEQIPVKLYIMMCLVNCEDAIAQSSSSEMSGASVGQKYNVFRFYISKDLLEWGCYSDESDDFIIDLPLNLNDITVEDLGFDNTYRILSPFLYCSDDNVYYLYFCRQDLINNKFDIYRTFYKDKWMESQLVIQNAFNPSVVQDYYFGYKLHRLYYNTQQDGKLVIRNCYISKFNPQFQQKYVFVDKVTSNQNKYCSLDDILAGDNSWCEMCHGTGKIQQKQCYYCHGVGVVKSICYKFFIPKKNFPQIDNTDESDFNYVDAFDYFVNIYPKNTDKNYRLYSDWYDYNDAINFEQPMTPSRRWKFLQF